jgi:hypothetical protein
LLSLTVAALGFALSSATPAQAYSFVTSQAAFDAATTSQSNIVFTIGATGNPVTGTVSGTSNQYDVGSSYLGNLSVSSGSPGTGQIRGISAGSYVYVNDFTVSGVAGVKTGALFFGLEGAAPGGGTASIYVNGTFAETYTFSNDHNTYLGILGSGISSVSVVGANGEQLKVIKDLQVGSPVPEFGSLLGLGGLLAAGGFAGLRRRRASGQ